MSVEITYDPTDVDAGEFSADELDSLQVGEQLEQAEERQLAGKYANAEELEQAYLNLQQKMGERGQEEYEEEYEEEEYNEYDDSDVAEYDDEVFSLLWEEIEAYGSLTEETIDVLAENMDADELIQLGMQMNDDTPADLDQQDVYDIQNFAGGEESYANLIGWAGENLDQQYIEAFDSVVDTADPAAIQLVVAGLMATYQENAGYEGRMLSGRNAPDVSGIQPFRSQAQVVAAMSDPRYDNDPAYRAEIAQRLEISNTFFE
jgi:hypothetical protein